MGREGNRLTLFAGCNGPSLTGIGSGDLTSGPLSQAGVLHFTTHQLRHTFGTEVASAGLTGSELQALMGHEDLSTTQQYIRVTGRDLERAMARLKAWREARGSVAQEVNALLKPAKPRQ